MIAIILSTIGQENKNNDSGPLFSSSEISSSGKYIFGFIADKILYITTSTV